MAVTFLLITLTLMLLSHWQYDTKTEGYLLTGGAVSCILAITCFIVGI